MKKKYIVIALLMLAACSAAVVFCYVQPEFIGDEVANSLLNDVIGRLAVALALIIVVCMLGYSGIFTNRCKNLKKALLWCVPCLFVAIANFPFSALIRGTARIERYDLLWLFIADCFCVALMEEVLFRGLLLSVLLEIFRNRYAAAILIQSAVFALCHLFNLFSGAAVGSTFLQAGYTFLLAIMFACVCLRTKNIWAAILLHTIFNVGGNLVSVLGSGAFQDTIFWILTIFCGVICALHIIGSGKNILCSQRDGAVYVKKVQNEDTDTFKGS